MKKGYVQFVIMSISVCLELGLMLFKLLA